MLKFPIGGEPLAVKFFEDDKVDLYKLALTTNSGLLLSISLNTISLETPPIISIRDLNYTKMNTLDIFCPETKHLLSETDSDEDKTDRNDGILITGGKCPLI
jgi:hypothetical protein